MWYKIYSNSSLTHIYLPLQTKFTKAVEDVVLQYTYPRIDAEVSKHRNHLLKSPFCVHPGTGTLKEFFRRFIQTNTSQGRVCVPINPSLIDEFDPDTVPTVGQLLNELDNVKAEDSEAAGRRMEGKFSFQAISFLYLY